MKRLVASAILGLLGFATAGLGDAIQKWQAPDGSLYFGDRPPKGSVLVETYADTPALAALPASSNPDALSQAAADGREIIRQREAAREAERQTDAARELRMAEIEASQVDGYDWSPFWLTTGGIVPCRFGEPCAHDFRFDHGHFPREMRDRFFHDRFFPRRAFVPGKRFLSGNDVFRHRGSFPRTFTRSRFAPAPAPRRSFQMSARFGGRR